MPLAFEFRHESWRTEEVFDLLREKNAAFVIAETDKEAALRLVTSSLAYVRLRKSVYTSEELDDWSDWVTRAGQEGDVYVYFKHSTSAPKLAADFLASCTSGSEPS
jgi:uncharacterized protein YecE (DUF72 family)